MTDENKIALDNIEAFGCHILHILEEDEEPPFSYSIGIQKKQNAPEIIVIGLKAELSHSIINDYNERVKNGEEFKAGHFYSDFIGGFEIKFEKVHASHFREYFGWARWLYDGNNFDALQMIYPNTLGVWPWDEIAGDWFRSRQPILKDELKIDPKTKDES